MHTFVLVSTGIYAASISMAGIVLPLALILVSRGIKASALPMPLACLPGPHILATIGQLALPCAFKDDVSQMWYNM